MLGGDALPDTGRDLPVHLDLVAEDCDAAVERLPELGATVREREPTEEHGERYSRTVVSDTTGDHFCVSEEV